MGFGRRIGAMREARPGTASRSRRLRVLAGAVLLAAAGFGVVTPSAPRAEAAAPVRVMPLGDSITGGPGCWRALLWNRLQNSGYTDVDFVGTLPGGGCNLANWDGDNEGHGGFKAIDIANQNLLPGWLAATKPDIVLMHLGTNDIWGNPPTADILAAYGTLVDQMRASNPAMKILVAQIIPMDPPQCATCAPAVVALDKAIPAWAASKSTDRSPIVVVDQWTGFDPVADTLGDGVHPNDSGFAKLADRWYPPLVRLLGGTSPSPTGSPTSASPSPSGTSPSPGATSPTPNATSPTPTPSGGAGCTAAYTVANSWSGGFQGQVVVTSTGTRATKGWSVSWTFPGGQTVGQVWGGTGTQTGPAVTVVNAAWNGALATGTTASFGFTANGTGAPPTDIICRAS